MNSEYELLCGSDKFLRICDTRQSLYYKNSIDDEGGAGSHKKEILGIKFDPFEARRFASFSEDTIKIFDLRMTKKA